MNNSVVSCNWFIRFHFAAIFHARNVFGTLHGSDLQFTPPSLSLSPPPAKMRKSLTPLGSEVSPPPQLAFAPFKREQLEGAFTALRHAPDQTSTKLSNNPALSVTFHDIPNWRRKKHFAKRASRTFKTLLLVWGLPRPSLVKANSVREESSLLWPFSSSFRPHFVQAQWDTPLPSPSAPLLTEHWAFFFTARCEIWTETNGVCDEVLHSELSFSQPFTHDFVVRTQRVVSVFERNPVYFVFSHLSCLISSNF